MSAAQPDPASLLAAVADALNACERAGISVDLAHGALVSPAGYVLPAGPAEIGCRWAARPRTPRDQPEVIRAHRGNEYPSHAMTAADVTPLVEKEVG